MTLRFVLTDGDGIQGLTMIFGAYLTSASEQTAADVLACQAALQGVTDQATLATTAASEASSSQIDADNQAAAAAVSAGAADASRIAAGSSATAAAGSASVANTASGSASAHDAAANNSAVAAASSAAQAAASAAPVASAATLINQLSGRNRALNGTMDYAQVPSGVVPNNTTTFAGADMWGGSNIGAAGQFTISQSTITYQGRVIPCQAAQVNTIVADLSGSNFWIPLRYIAEGYHVYDLVNQPFVISFPFYCTISGNYAISVRDTGGAYSFVTSFSAVAGVQYVSVPVPASPAGSTMVRGPGTGLSISIGSLNNSAFITPTPGAWVAGNYLTVATKAAWGSTVGAAIAIGGEFQFEKGTLPTVFEKPEISDTILRCNRYLTQLRFDAYGYGAAGQTVGAGFKEFMVPMRAVPIVTTLTAGSSINANTPTAVANVTGAVSVCNSTALGAYLSSNWVFRFGARLGEVA